MTAPAGVPGVVVNRIAAVGLGIVAAMHLLFVLTSLASPFVVFSVLGFAGACACAWGLWRAPGRVALAALAAGMGVLLAVRAFYFARGLPAWDLQDLGGAVTVAGFVVAFASALLWAWQPAAGEARSRGLRVGLALVALGYFLTMGLNLGSGSISMMVGMLLGAVGFSLAAPNVVAGSAEAGGPGAPVLA